MLMKYEGTIGEHISRSARNAIALAEKHNRKVRMVFNDVSITVNKRLSVRHVFRTWQDMIRASDLRYRRSQKYLERAVRQRVEAEMRQVQIDELMGCLPDRGGVVEWLAKYIPLTDHVGVQSYAELVVEHLRSLGFVSGQHVDDYELRAGTAADVKRVEYLAGQVISMMERVGAVHPIIGEWAEELAGKGEVVA